MAYEEAVVIGSAALTYVFFWLSFKMEEDPTRTGDRQFDLFKYVSVLFFFIGLSFAINTVALMHTVSAGGASAETNSTIGTELVILSWSQKIVYFLFLVQVIIMALAYAERQSEDRWRVRK